MKTDHEASGQWDQFIERRKKQSDGLLLKADRSYRCERHNIIVGEYGIGEWKRKAPKLIRWSLGAALLLLVLGLSVNPTTANDLFWQLRVGHEIVTTYHLPYSDTYSWTRYGAPCVMHEWMAFVLLWKAYDMAGGFAGIWLLQVGLVLALFGLLYRLLLRETEGAPFTAFLLAIGAALASNAYFQPRPHLFTYLMATAAVGIVCKARRHPEHWKQLGYLPPLFLVWSNLHSGALLGLLLLVMFVVGDALDVYVRTAPQDPIKSRQESAVRRLALVTVACAATTLINPYGVGIYHDFIATLRSATAMNAVTEWASPDFHQISGKLLEMVAAVVALGLVCSHRKCDTATLLISVALLHGALLAYRNVPIFAIIAILINANHVQSALTRLIGVQKANGDALLGQTPSGHFVPVIVIVFATVTILRCARAMRDETYKGIETIARASIMLRSFPERACRFMETEPFPTTIRLFNDYNYGGFLIWRLPQFPVFVDGRADVYFGKVLDDCVRIHGMKPDWQNVLSRYEADVAIVSEQSPEAFLLKSAPEWTLVYADRAAPASLPDESTLIFIRSLPKYQALIARCRKDCRYGLWATVRNGNNNIVRSATEKLL